MPACKKCGIDKSLDAFYRRSNGTYHVTCSRCQLDKCKEYRDSHLESRRAYCRAYQKANPHRIREIQLRNKFGIGREQVVTMLHAQGGKCAICGNFMGKPCVDHDHKTKKVRSLLCGKCNTGLGQFNDSAELLLQAALYLERNK